MTPETALNLITAIGLGVWLLALRSYLRASRPLPDAGAVGAFEPTRQPGTGEVAVDRDGALVGTVRLAQGDPELLADRGRRALADGRGLSIYHDVRIEDAGGGSQVAFSLGGLVPSRGGGRVTGFTRRTAVAVRLERDGRGGVRCDYRIDRPPAQRLLNASGWLLAVGLLFVIGLHVALRTLVLPLENERLRWQTLQMILCVHLLWPPFLLLALRRGQLLALRDGLETFLHNLPHLGAASPGNPEAGQ